MNELEKIKAEILRLKDIQCSPILLCEDLVSFIDSLPEEKVSKDLEEAAYKYSDDIYEKNRNKCNPDWNSYADGYEQAICCHVSDAFIEGANWQKEQMMKDAIYGLVCGHDKDTPAWIDLNLLNKPKNAKVGEEIKLIIIKEN